MFSVYLIASMVIAWTDDVHANDPWSVVPPVQCGASEPDLSDVTCDQVQRDDLISKLEQISSRSATGAACTESGLKAIRCCFDPESHEECQYKNFNLENGLGSSADMLSLFDSNIERHVLESNRFSRESFICKRWMGRCESDCKRLDFLHKAYQNSEASALASRGRTLINEVIKLCQEDLGQREICLKTSSKQLLFNARRTLGCTSSIVSNRDSAKIICYRNSNELEQCQYTKARNINYADLSDSDQISGINDQIHPSGIVETISTDSENNRLVELCSGTPIGDGSYAITAAHCMRENAENRISIEVEGSYLTRTMSCPPVDHYSGGAPRDTVLCRLNEPVPLNESIFVMAYDPSVKQGCVPEDYFLRCGLEELRKQNTVKMISTPFSQSGEDGLLRPIYSRGVASLDQETLTFQSSLFSDRGSSGGGIIVELEGRRVLISNESTELYFSQQSSSPVILWEDIANMKTTLNDEKLIGSEPIFSGAPN